MTKKLNETPATGPTRRRELIAERNRVKKSRRDQNTVHEAFMAKARAIASKPLFKIALGQNGLEASLPMMAVGGSSSGGTVPVAFDMEAFLYRALLTEMAEEGRRVLDDEYTFNATLVMTEDEQQTRIREIDAEIVALEREEVDSLFAALDEGRAVRFDPSFDPRSLLGIVGPALPRLRTRHNRIA